LLQSLNKPQPERKENNFYTNRWPENQSERERERIIITYRSAWSFGFDNRLRGDAILQWTSLPFPNFASALTGCLAEYLCHRHYFFFFLISAKQITNHHPPLPNNKSNDGQTNKTNNTTRTLPLPKRVKEPGKQQDLQQSEK
jgi:hypothetical protein